MPKFDFGKGAVPAHQHPRGKGWVADSALIAPNARVGPDAQVFGDATLANGARVEDQARVFGQATIESDAKVGGSASVFGHVRVRRGAYVNKTPVFGSLPFSWHAYQDHRPPAPFAGPLVRIVCSGFDGLFREAHPEDPLQGRGVSCPILFRSPQNWLGPAWAEVVRGVVLHFKTSSRLNDTVLTLRDRNLRHWLKACDVLPPNKSVTKRAKPLSLESGESPFKFYQCLGHLVLVQPLTREGLLESECSCGGTACFHQVAAVGHLYDENINTMCGF